MLEPGPGYIHTPAGREAEWYAQLTAEQVVTRAGGAREWVKVRERNEALDCRVYAMAALHLLGVDLSAPVEEAQKIPYRPAKRVFRGGGRKQ